MFNLLKHSKYVRCVRFEIEKHELIQMPRGTSLLDNYRNPCAQRSDDEIMCVMWHRESLSGFAPA